MNPNTEAEPQHTHAEITARRISTLRFETRLLGFAALTANLPTYLLAVM